LCFSRQYQGVRLKISKTGRVNEVKEPAGIPLNPKTKKLIMKHHTYRKILCAAAGAVILMIAIPQKASAARGLFVGDQYYQPGSYYAGKAKDSKMNTLFLFTLQVNSDGTLRFNDHIVCRNGSYVGNSVWDQQLNNCRGGSVDRIELAIGNWNSDSFNHIRNLQAAANLTGTPVTQTILYRNFRALKNKITVDAIQMDDEKTYNRTSMVAFCKMLADNLGWRVSLCPYNNQSFWKGVKADLPNRVSGVWLQCYEGGVGNDPVQWRTALGNTGVLYPGEQIFSGRTAVVNRAKHWKLHGFKSVFMWGDNRTPDPAWGQWLIDGGY
jgi:hypothetical protein